MKPDTELSLAPLDTPAAAATPAPPPAPPGGRTCPRCHYTRQSTDTAPAWQCPRCEVVYDKAVPRSRARGGDEDEPPRPARSTRQAAPQRPWTLIALGGAVLAGAALLAWKAADDRDRATQQAARAASDARAALVDDTRASGAWAKAPAPCPRCARWPTRAKCAP
jgi:hypothetical protein